jgi:predicted O-methyltransferase YrrM
VRFYLEKQIALLQIRIFKYIIRNRLKPIPLKEYFAFHEEAVKRSSFPDPLLKAMPDVYAEPTKIRNPRLRAILASRSLGNSALSVSSLNYLEGIISRYKPNCVLEFGSGISTLALRLFLNEQVGVSSVLFSVEQSDFFLKKTKDDLTRNGLSDSIQFFHAPLIKGKMYGRSVDCYALYGLRDFLHGNKPELVLIDGPLGVPGSRVHVLPEVKDLLSPCAVFLLDDAIRDGETWIARQWSKVDQFHISGVVMTGKGFLLGKVMQ